MKKTKNYAMPYPEQDDYFNVEDFQDMMVFVDDLIKKLSDSGAQISSDAEHLYNQTKAQMDNIQKRMNAFTALKEGSTTGDAELKDIRVAYDGKVYGNAGEAVREQASDIHKALFGNGVSIWSKTMSQSTKYVTAKRGIFILNEPFVADGVITKINRGTFRLNETKLGLDKVSTAYIVKFENTSGTMNVPSLENLKGVSACSIKFEEDGNAHCWIPVEKGQYLAVTSTVTAYETEDSKVPYMFWNQEQKTMEYCGFTPASSTQPAEPHSLALEYKLEYDMDDAGLVKQVAANRETAALLKEDIGDLSSENGIDYKQINSALTQNKTHLKDTSSDGSCYQSNGVVKSNNVSGYKKMQIDVSELPDSGTLVIPFTESGLNDFAIFATEKTNWSNNPVLKQTYTYSSLVNNDHSAASYYHLKWNNNGDGTASLDCTIIKSYIDSRPMLCFFIKNDNNQWFIPYILSSGKKKKLSWLITDKDNLDESIDWNIYNGFANIFNKVVCIGDSLTFGQLSGKNSSTQVHSPYPKVLSKLLNTTVDVVAVPGITSKGWYDNKYSSVDFDNYDCAIIWLGTNGGVNYPVGSSATDENTIAYQNIIDGIKSQNPQCKIICIGNVMPFYTRVLKDIAKEKNCVFLDIYHGQLMFDIRRSTADPGSATIYHPSESDWVHFSQIGYIAVANIIYRMLCKAIFENHDYFEFIN